MNRQTVIIDGLSPKTDTHAVSQLCLHILKTLKIPHKLFSMAADEIKPCTGCGVCGRKTVGLCIYKDKGAELTARMSQSDLMIILTRIRYGAYDQPVKQAVDRFSLLGTPYFLFRNAQMHHITRYDNRQSHLIFAMTDRPRLALGEQAAGTVWEDVAPIERTAFEDLVNRDAELMNCIRHKVLWLHPSQKDLRKTMEASILNMFDASESR